MLCSTACRDWIRGGDSAQIAIHGVDDKPQRAQALVKIAALRAKRLGFKMQPKHPLLAAHAGREIWSNECVQMATNRPNHANDAADQV
tara:strand:+ start:408 stop:671 length:264 start_codon:yes stop_codon:yes gene_type:complete